MGKLNVLMLRYLSSEEFRVLTAVSVKYRLHMVHISKPFFRKLRSSTAQLRFFFRFVICLFMIVYILIHLIVLYSCTYEKFRKFQILEF